MGKLINSAAVLLKRLESSQILLVEWETSLQIRLGYPLVSNGSLFLLVPDGQLQEVRDLATDVGLTPATTDTLSRAYPCEMCDLALRFLTDESTRRDGPPRRRLVFLPLSWTGISREEVVPISGTDVVQQITSRPSTVHTVPLPAACAALVRIVARERRGSLHRTDIIEGLCSVITYGLFDMSYDGDYMDIPPNEQPLSDEEKLEINNAVEEMRRWTFRTDEEWMREFLIQIVTGSKTYDDLPCREAQKM